MPFFPGGTAEASGAHLVLGDGSFVRDGLAAVVDFLHRYAAPTGARGSVMLMAGGLLVLAFLFTAFLFRSAIVGDLAPVANARRPLPRARLPGERPRGVIEARGAPPVRFDAARRLGHEAATGLDEAFEEMAALGVDARIVQSRSTWKVVRVHRCASCEAGVAEAGCENERGLLAGVFERLTGDLAKVEEVACVAGGAAHCEFEIRHAALLRTRAPRSVAAR
jgi:predicted hydrocarbon binding protein